MNIPIELKDKISRISNLPTLPQVASQILEYINHPGISTNDIGSLVSQDISLSAKILRLANSAFYGMPRSIGNINEAIVLLGFKVLYTMILSLTVFDMFAGDKLSARFNKKMFWKHSLLCGLLSKLIAEAVPGKNTDTEEAFCAGLLHDIGKIVMEQYLHDDLHKAIDYGNKSTMSFVQSEQAVLGYTHTDVAEVLISRWNLPDNLFFPIIYHHSPENLLQDDTRTSSALLCAFCHVADYFCYDRNITGERSTIAPPPLNTQMFEFIGLDSDDLETITMQVPKRLQQMSVLFDFFTM